ncbi:serine/threonine-protein kinase [Streptomyces antibioticus]
MGEVFAGRYELADPIGRGGVGAVWRAWDHRRRRYVAAKVLQQSDAHTLLRFVREQALRIDHPHVLAPASWAADDDKVLFTMDLVGGGSLVHLVGDYGPLPTGFVCTLLDQLLSGLAAVHAEGVVHRDIKPANLLLEATGTARPRLRLSDFGIAMRLGEPRLTETNLVVGTPGYLAPEQMMGSEPDFPADLFAVGLVALYLLEGAKPDAKALVQYFTEHGTPGAPKGIPEPLWQVVAALLQPDPEDRFRTATGARKALAAAVELLPEPGPDDELIEIFDQIGPLPKGFGPDGPLKPSVLRPPNGMNTGAGIGGTGLMGSTGSVPLPAAPTTPPPTPTSTPFATPVPARPVPPPPPAPPGTGSVPERPEAPPRTDHQGTPSPPSNPTPPPPAPSMSDTGSFLLPPPQATPAPALTVAPHEATFVLPGRAPVQRTDPSTASYTAQDAPAATPAAAPVAAPVAVGPRRRGRRAKRRSRPGPPLKVAVPLLLLALACYGVGFWALTRI